MEQQPFEPTTIYHYRWGGSAGFPIDTFVATVGNRTFKGYWKFAQPGAPYPDYFRLCAHLISGCTRMNATVIDDNHIKLSNHDGQSFQMMRNGITTTPTNSTTTNSTNSTNSTNPADYRITAHFGPTNSTSTNSTSTNSTNLLPEPYPILMTIKTNFCS